MKLDRRRWVLVGQVALGVVGLAAVVVAFGMAGVIQLPGDAAPSGDGVGSNSVIISEFASASGGGVTDADGDASDWLELRNVGDEAIDLEGYYVSDDPDQPDRWRLPRTELPPDGHLVVWASGKDVAKSGQPLHTNFQIAADGEALLLVAPDGTTVLDRVDAVAIPPNASYGRDTADPERFCYYAFPKPGTANTSTCFADADLGAPTLSVPSGFYDAPFALEITSDIDDATIVYTLDGSYPDPDGNPDATRVYEWPLRIADRTSEPNGISRIETSHPSEAPSDGAPDQLPDFDESLQKGTVVRARITDGAETAGTYFVGAHLVRPGLSVVSLAVDPAYLFDHDQGIYVAGRLYAEHVQSGGEDVGPYNPANFHQRGREWERPRPGEQRRAVVFEHCAPGGACDYQTRIGIRVHGGASRAFQQKSLRLYARNEYGAATFDYPFFGTTAPREHRRLILRNSGQGQRTTLFLDAYLQELMAHFTADTQASRPVVVFVNGEYWGLQHLRERYDEEYLEATYGADPEAVQLEDGGPGQTDDGELLGLLQSGDPADPAWAARIEAILDPMSFFDHLIANLFVANTDWPGNNVKVWREVGGPDAIGHGPRDGRWRWMIIDLDALNGLSSDWGVEGVEHDLLVNESMDWGDDPAFGNGLPFAFDQMMQNDRFRHLFLNRFADHLNTSFNPARTIPEMTAYEDLVSDEVARHFARWRTSDSDRWQGRLQDLRDYLRQRPSVQRRHLVDFFELDGTAELRLRRDAERGYVRVNTIDIERSTPGVNDPTDWQGVYFRGVPVQLEAVPYAGFRFVRWEGLPAGDPTAASVEVTLDGDLTLTPVFARD